MGLSSSPSSRRPWTPPAPSSGRPMNGGRYGGTSAELTTSEGDPDYHGKPYLVALANRRKRRLTSLLAWICCLVLAKASLDAVQTLRFGIGSNENGDVAVSRRRDKIPEPRRTSRTAPRGKEGNLNTQDVGRAADGSSKGGIVYDVLVVGAGAAGLTAAYEMQKRHKTNEDGEAHRVKILEASQGFGGRIQRDATFVDFPVSMGGTYIFDRRAPRLIADISKDRGGIYPSTKDGKIMCEEVGLSVFEKVGHHAHKDSYLDGECMWVNNSWYDFFADYVAPKDDDQDTISYGCKVDRIDYHDQHDTSSSRMSSKQHTVTVGCGNQEFKAKYVIVTVPLSILQDGDIAFSPPLPESIMSKKETFMWQGFKLLIEFSKKFFPDTFYWEEENGKEAGGESFFFDYSVFQNSNRTVLAGYFIGDPALSWLALPGGDDEVFQKYMERLDETFKGQASKYYVKHRVINWSKHPLTRGIYSNQPMETGVRNLNDIVFLAGEAFPLDRHSNGWVHGAAFSGKSAAHKILALEHDNVKVVERKLKNPYSLSFKYDEVVVDNGSKEEES